jgi:hypothetical protein
LKLRVSASSRTFFCETRPAKKSPEASPAATRPVTSWVSIEVASPNDLIVSGLPPAATIWADRNCASPYDGHRQRGIDQRRGPDGLHRTAGRDRAEGLGRRRIGKVGVARDGRLPGRHTEVFQLDVEVLVAEVALLVCDDEIGENDRAAADGDGKALGLRPAR